MEKVLHFLQELSENNNKEWFNDNRDRYDESRKKVLFITEVLINEISKFDPAISAMNPKDCMFRIFRDVRFSKDKRPYKTNFGSFIAKGGRKSMNPGYYFHLEPGQSFVGGGVYMPPAVTLKAIRSAIAENYDEFMEIVSNDDFKSTFPEMYEHRLKIAPKGFPKDHEAIALLRYKSFAFSSKIKNEEIIGADFINVTVQSFRQLYEVNSFLGRAIEKIG